MISQEVALGHKVTQAKTLNSWLMVWEALPAPTGRISGLDAG